MNTFKISILLILLSVFSNTVSAANQGDFDLIIGPIANNKFYSIKWNTKTGEGWFLNDNSTWNKIIDEKRIPKSQYLIRSTQAGPKWFAIRIDTVRGKTWQSIDGVWVLHQDK